MRYNPIEKAKEFEVNLGWVKSRRLFYFDQQIAHYQESIREMTSFLAGSNNEERAFILSSINNSKLKIEKIKKNRHFVQNVEKSKKGEITHEMVVRAKKYPVESIIEVRNGMAMCINHQDTRPSLNCKNNYVYCHSCTFHGDAIDVYMKVHNLSFIDAVKMMQ